MLILIENALMRVNNCVRSFKSCFWIQQLVFMYYIYTYIYIRGYKHKRAQYALFENTVIYKRNSGKPERERNVGNRPGRPVQQRGLIQFDIPSYT